MCLQRFLQRGSIQFGGHGKKLLKKAAALPDKGRKTEEAGTLVFNMRVKRAQDIVIPERLQDIFFGCFAKVFPGQLAENPFLFRQGEDVVPEAFQRKGRTDGIEQEVQNAIAVNVLYSTEGLKQKAVRAFPGRNLFGTVKRCAELVPGFSVEQAEHAVHGFRFRRESKYTAVIQHFPAHAGPSFA